MLHCYAVQKQEKGEERFKFQTAYAWLHDFEEISKDLGKIRIQKKKRDMPCVPFLLK